MPHGGKIRRCEGALRVNKSTEAKCHLYCGYLDSKNARSLWWRTERPSHRKFALEMPVYAVNTDYIPQNFCNSAWVSRASSREHQQLCSRKQGLALNVSE